jgi:hypothetical protein
MATALAAGSSTATPLAAAGRLAIINSFSVLAFYQHRCNNRFDHFIQQLNGARMFYGNAAIDTNIIGRNSPIGRSIVAQEFSYGSFFLFIRNAIHQVSFI